MRVTRFALIALLTGTSLGGCSSGGPGFESFGDGGTINPNNPPAESWALPYLPLKKGLEWTYRMTKADGTVGTACENNGGSLKVTITDDSPDNGVPTYTLTYAPACFYEQMALHINAGGKLSETSLGGTYNYLEFPPVQGEQWAAGGASGAGYSWAEHQASITVQGVAYDDCWKRTYNGGFDWYCKDVGMVHMVANVWQDASWELTAKNF
jgi:hypothetical protein